MGLVGRTTAVLIVALGAANASAGAQPRLAQLDSANRWVDSIFAPYSSTSSPGCAVGVVRDGQLAFAKGYGMADLEHDTPITPSTRFYIASLSKQFTAMSIVLLAQEGRLSLDDWVRRWVPQVPSFGAPITLRQLLHHTSGLRDYFTLLALSGWPSDGLLTEPQFVDLVSRQKNLNFTPGDEFLYSNTGYALLAMVVERASGQSLRDYAADHIFKPLGMAHTEFRDDHTQLIPHRAVGYQPTASGFRLEPARARRRGRRRRVFDDRRPRQVGCELRVGACRWQRRRGGARGARPPEQRPDDSLRARAHRRRHGRHRARSRTAGRTAATEARCS